MLLKRFNIKQPFSLSKLKSLGKEMIEPKAIDNGIQTNANLLFDDMSREWQAFVIGNSYDLNTFNTYTGVTQNNFGTVDNPHVIFTSDAPYRYVGCSGQPNEDDYEGHEHLYLMLREGPLQRCMSCGQVFKLVRLRDEFNEENEYYASGMVPYEIQELGEADHWHQQSVLRLMPYQFEHSLFENPAFNVYSLVNPDDHDRILTDPAYRLKKLKELEHKTKVVSASLHNLDISYKMDNPQKKRAVDKHDYEVLLDVEKNILKLDRHFKRIEKFNYREFVDPKNHERREKRMQERSNERLFNNSTIYLNELTEEEQKFRDYFETDLELNDDNEHYLQKLDELSLLGKHHYKLANINFREGYSRQPLEDNSSMLDKILFRFKHRRADMDFEEYTKREQNMIELSKKRMSDVNYNKAYEYFNNITQSKDLTMLEKAKLDKKYLEFIMEEALNQVKDFYSGYKDIDISMLNDLTNSQKIGFLGVFVDVKRYENKDDKYFISVPDSNYDSSKGLLENLSKDVFEYRNNIKPLATFINNVNLSNIAVPNIDYNEYRNGGKLPKVGESVDDKKNIK